MSPFRWISEGLKTLRISKSVALTGPDYQARSPPLLGTAANVPIPAKPKRPVSPFVRFSLSAREEVKKQNPAAGPRDILKLCAIRWKDLAEPQKLHFSKSFEAEMANYAKEIAKYNSALTPEQKQAQQEMIVERNLRRQKLEKRQRLAELGKPKKPGNPFMNYLNKHITKGTQPDKFKGMVKELSEKWKTLSANEKAPFVQKYEKDRADYERELAKWEEKMIRMGHDDLVRLEVTSVKKKK